MKIYVVDNGGQWTHKEYRVLKSLGVESQIVDNDMDLLKIEDANGWVLSGGAPSINEDLDELKEVGKLLDNVSVPVFGICIGAQFMALHSGGTTRKAPIPEFGRAKIHFFNQGGIFKSIPSEIYAWENHNDEITSLGKAYTECAQSDNCKIQAFYNNESFRYGVQFHPEVENTEFGKEMFKSFIEICKQQT